MAIVNVAQYIFSDFLLNDPGDAKYAGARLELALDKMVRFLALGLPLFLISLAFAQEVSVGTRISCFTPTNFSMQQAAYVDSFCWAAVEPQAQDSPLWLHKFFPYVLLFVAMLLYIVDLFWSFTAAPHLASDLKFIMTELDRFYNRTIKMVTNLASGQDSPGGTQSVSKVTEGCLKCPLVEHYLKSKCSSRFLLTKYLVCRGLTLVILLLTCLFLGYYIHLANHTDEFTCHLRTGMLKNNSAVPSAVQCKLVAVGIFGLLSKINFVVYALLCPIVVYAAIRTARQSCSFLRPYEILPGFGSLSVSKPFCNDLSIYLRFLEENLSNVDSFKHLQVLQELQEAEEGEFDAVCLLRTLSQVKSDVTDSKVMSPKAIKEINKK